jgi:multiple sugar transport system substrate-binding protein
MKRYAMRTMSATLAVAVTGTLAVACGSSTGGTTKTASGSTGNGPVTITFESYNYGTPDLGGQGTQELIDNFEKAHPNITIKPSGASAADILPKVQAQTAAGNAPDIAQLGWSKEPAALANLPIVPIADVAPAADVSAQTAGILPQALAAGDVGGKLTAMPYTISTPTLFYNASLFTKAHLDPTKPPTTWAEVKTDALAIKKLGGGAQGAYVDAANAAKSDFLTQSLINSNGGALVSPSGAPQLDSPAAVGALSMLGDLSDSGAQPKISETDATSLFKAGKLGMYVTSTALLASLTKAAAGSFTLKTAGLPAFGTLPAKPTYSGSGLFILSKDAAKRAAAWEFVKYLTSDAGFTVITEKIGYLPLRQSTVDGAQYLGTYLTAHPAVLPAFKQLTTVTPYQEFSGPHADQARQVLQDDAVSAVMLNGADPAATAKSVNARLLGLVGKS